jgi:hypothetical protein
MGEKHALPGDKKARKSEQGKHGRWGKSMHRLETRRQEKCVRQTWVMGEKHALPRDRKARKVSKANMGNGGKNVLARDKKARKSEQDKHG